MYMSSRERLREKDYERKQHRGSGGAGVGGAGAGSSSNHSGGRGDPFLAETAISEEPPTNTEIPNHDRTMDPSRHIPARDSSLRKTSSSKRSSGRKPKREQDGSLADVIAEAEEPARTPQESSKRKTSKSIPTLDPQSFLNYQPTGGAATASSTRQTRESSRVDESRNDGGAVDVDDDGAPFPAVSQGRRREDHSAEPSGRRLSGRQSPGPGEAVKLKRSSSRLKRFSGQLSPRPDEESNRGPSTDTQRPVGYERPQSADSVDDAVESYLCSPRLSQKIRHPQTGRTISFSEVGDANGSAVFCCVGMGLTRYITAFYDELALTLKLRLITPDRPGVGDSEPYSDGTATPLGWPGTLRLYVLS